MVKGRLEAFSDGVIAIIITIMVLELKIPHESDLAALLPLLPTFLSYVLSFVYVGIYWNNHHHLFQAVRHVNGATLWANLHLLFWLSLFPFATAWMGENHFAALPVALYGVVLLLAAIAYFALTRTLILYHGQDSTLANALGRDLKGKLSVLIYAVAIPLAFAIPWLACALYVLVAVMWLVPDRRIEKTLDFIGYKRVTLSVAAYEYNCLDFGAIGRVLDLFPIKSIELIKFHVLMRQKTATNPPAPERSQVIGKKQRLSTSGERGR